jgi:CRISPR-associated protein Cmr4
MNSRLLCLHARSPIHCGTGQAIGGIDLPIAREKPTNLPLIPGSSLKGVLRALERDDSKDTLHRAVFGPPTAEAHEHAGAVQFGDARLLFLPVRSVRGTFAWATSPYLLRRFLQDCADVGLKLPRPPSPAAENRALIAPGSRLLADKRVVFEDFDFDAQESPEFEAFLKAVATALLPAEEIEHFTARACAVHDDVMSVLLQTATEITARIRLDPDTKTVETGALWTEEALPVESILVGIVLATPLRERPGAAELFGHVKALLARQKGAVQVGGNASIGRGLCRAKLVKGAV